MTESRAPYAGEGWTRAILDAAVDGIIAIDARGRIELFNAAAERLLGYAADEVLGRNVSMLMPPPESERHDGYLERYLSTGERHIIGIGREVTARRKDGALIAVHLAVGEVAGPDGPPRFAGVLRDLSEERATRESLRQQLELAEQLFDTAPAIILVLDTEGRIVRFNRYLERVAGRPLDEVRGRSWFDTFLPERDRARIRDVHERTLAEERTTGTVNPIVTKDGRELTIQWHNAALTDGEGEVRGALSVGLDLTERLEVERQLRQAQRLEAIGRLASGIAHDFNNLLSGIAGCAKLVLQDAEPGSRAHLFAEEIRASAIGGTKITRQLLNLGRERQAGASRVDLEALIRAARKLLAGLLTEEIELIIEAERGGAFVLGDAGELDQALMNLVVNARDAMPGPGRISIRTGEVEVPADDPVGRRPGAYVTLSVEDTGVGMDAETRERAFEPFFTTKGTERGSGLGLSTVYGIVRQRGGYVDIESEPGRGTTVRLLLPSLGAAAGGEDASVTPAAREGAVAGAPPPALGGLVALVVEDERLVRVAVRSYLERLGLSVLAAEDIDQALALARRHADALRIVVSDMVLPGGSGAALVEELEAMRPGLAFVFISAYPKALLVESGRLREGVEVLQKPFEESQLLDKLVAAMEAARRRS